MSATGRPPLRRGVTIQLNRDLLTRLLGLPQDVWVEHVWGDPARESINLMLTSNKRFDPVPEGAEVPRYFPMIELRMMPAPPVTGDDEPQHAPNPGDVLFFRLDLTGLPAPDEETT